MAIGVNSENQNMRLLVKELLVNGGPVTGAPGASITPLTNNTGATANDTVENVPAAVAAATGADTATLPTLTSVNASLTAVENNISDLTAKVNAIISALSGS